MSNSLSSLLNAKYQTRFDYLSARGFNSANEGGEEVTSQLFGYEVTDSLGNVSWISESLFIQLNGLYEKSLDDDKETPVPEVELIDLYNVYSEDRRDEINNKSKADKPKVIRVTGGEQTIPDGYVRTDSVNESKIYILK